MLRGMSEASLHFGAVVAMFVLAGITFATLQFVTAPYGRHLREGWGPQIPSRLGWIVMESPSALGFLWLYFRGAQAWEMVPLALMALWQLHYLHRTFIFPFRMRIGGKKMPLSIVGMAIGTLIGGLLQLAVQLPALFSCGFTFLPRFNFYDPGLIRILKLMIPAVIGLSATQINIFINTKFAASCAEGSVSWLQYAFRLVQLPIGIFGVAIGVAAMPLLARYSASKNIDGMKETFVSSLTMVFCLTIPASAGLYLLAEPIIKLIFERGAFTAADTVATAQAVSLYAVGLFAYSANKVLVPVFYALGKTRFPVIGSFITVCINIIIITLTIDFFQHRAIAFSVSVTMIINFFFLTTVLYRELNGFSVLSLWRAFMKILVATALMIAFLFAARSLTGGYMEGPSLIAGITSLFGIITVAAVLYGATLYFLKVDELTYIIKKIRSKMF